MNWIDVKEKLPELKQGLVEITSGPVLVYRAKYKKLSIALYESWYTDYETEQPVFSWKTDCSEGWDITDEVTHWMPLPEPPTV